ncbi:alpha-ketoglutarate-dependent dioxygenase alkB homolog 3-like [Watersipora subatra]|uniref:alpha-ketoglutarate-dependent dioxygenase alkB homolog 3-like n=1 Tax=Watersipora subatra TaxID=2589382 RepID=UPI00355BF8FD
MSGKASRRSRVQGGWANSSPQSSAAHKKTAAVEDVHKLPVWIGNGKDSDLPQQSALKFHQPDEKDMQNDAAETQLITTPGIYDLSDEPSGISRVKLFHNFLDAEAAAKLMKDLLENVPWEQKCDIKDGRARSQPRVVAWYGNVEYSYSGLTHPPRPDWLPSLLEVKKMLEENSGLQFNSVLCNMYKNGKDHVSWHSDDEPLFGRLPTIATVSLGDTRVFELRKKVPPTDTGEYIYREYVRIPLPAGSLLLMEGATQLDWQHRIPIEYHDREKRISLTYRYVVS